METLTFQPVLSPILMGIVALLAIGMLLLGPSFAKLDGKKRWTLSLIRLGVILLAFLTLLRPGCTKTEEKNQAAVLFVLLDVSRSMSLPHVSDDSSRWKTSVEMLRDNQSRFQKLMDEKVEVKFVKFDSRSETIEFSDGGLDLPKTPDGSETDIGTAIYNAGLDVRDRPVTGMILVSDCVQNIPEPEVEFNDAIESLVEKEVPLIGVKLGTPGSTSQLKDVAITSFAEQQIVNKKSDLTATTTLIARGYANQDIQVDLVLTDGNKEETVATEIVRPDQSYQEISVDLKYRPTKEGEFRISARARAMPGEVALRNNSLDGFLTVTDEGLRVLFLSGGLSWEQRSLIHYALPALEFVELDFRPIYTDSFARRAWPLQEFSAEFAEEKKYDVVILCNVDSRALYDHDQKTGPLIALERAVKNGTGLLMIGGTHSFDPGMYAGTPLRDVLPVKLKSGARQGFEEDVRFEYHINKPFPVIPLVNNFLTRISDGPNRAAWEKLPPLVGANRLSPKRTAEVFLESNDETRRPILIAGNYGSGRVLAFAGDSTWRWRTHGYPNEFSQFWRQLVLWLAFWDNRNDERLSIELPRRRYAPKSRMKFGVSVRTISGENVTTATFDAVLVSPNRTEQPLSITRTGESYECQLDRNWLSDAGVYRIRVQGSNQGEEIGTAEREFVVIDQDREKSNPAANPEQMTRLANQTSEFGGKAIAPDELGAVLDEMIENPRTKKIKIPTTWRLGQSMADASAFMLAFVGLLAVEWVLRKKWGLV